MPFNPNYTPITTIDTDIRGSTGVDGTIGSQWVRFNNWPPVSGGFTLFNPTEHIFECIGTGAGNAPTIYYQNASVPNGNIPHRISGSCRAADGNFGSPPGLRLFSPLILVYGTRSLINSNGTSPTILAGPYSKRPIGTGIVRITIINTGFGISNTYDIELSINADVFYRIGIEVLGNIIQVYCSNDYNANPNGLIGNSNLSLIFSTTVPKSCFEGPPVFAGMSAGGHLVDNTIGCAFCDVVLEALATRPVVPSVELGGIQELGAGPCLQAETIYERRYG